MSSRVLRKLQGDNLEGGQDGEKEDPKEGEEEEDLALTRGARPRRPNLNPFELVSECLSISSLVGNVTHW